jgi:hypothetical protein
MSNIDRNPCEDLPEPQAENGCPDGLVPGADGGCVDANGVGSQPLETPAEPRQQEEEFPEAHQRSEYRNAANSEENAPSRDVNPEFSTATRDYTTVFNGSFANFDSITALSDRYDTPNHASNWLSYQPESIKHTVDKFRMAISNMWHRLPDNPLAPHLLNSIVGDPRNRHAFFSPEQNRDNNIPGEGNANVEPYTRIIRLDGRLNEAFYSKTPVRNSSEIKEKFRFIFPENLISSNPAIPATPIKFIPPNSDITRLQFLDVYMHGKRSENYEDFKQKFNDRSSELYSQGSIDFDKEFLDYTYITPAAFFEKELDGVLVSPSHSADLEVKIQNVEPITGLDYELNIPSAYEFYQAAITKRRIPNIDGPADIPNELANIENWINSVMSEYRNAIDMNLENNNLGFSSSQFHKFPSDRVARLEEVNKDIRKLAENYVEIKIKSRQGGHLSSILQSNRMDIIALEYLAPTPGTFLAEYLRINSTSADPRLSPEVRAAFAGPVPAPGYARGERLQPSPAPAPAPVDDLPDPQVPYAIDDGQRVTRILDDEFIGTNDNPTVSLTRNDKVRNNVPTTIYKNFDKLIHTLAEEADVSPQSRNIEDYPLHYAGWDNTEILRIEEAISSQIFLTQLNLACREHELQRSFADILYGRKAYSETIGYKIEKYRISKRVTQSQESGETQTTENEMLIQTFLLMDNNSIDRINFIDSQILPNQEYVYKIFTMNLVIGNKYNYSEEESEFYFSNPRFQSAINPFRNCFDLSVTSDRMILLNCAPFFEKKVSTKDRPPITPQVNFLPFNGIEDRYNILMDTNYGERLERPIIIKRDDRREISRMHKAETLSQGKNLLYRSDSLPEHFEIFQIDFEPKSYRDFEFGLNYKIPATGKTGLFKLEVEPNKFYYYTFRAHDSGGMSNPTEVYRVRMVSYQNGIFMEMDTYEMYQEPRKANIQFERFIHIKPNFSQSTVNFSQVLESIEADNFPNRVREQLGLREDKINSIEFQRSAPDIERVSLGNTPDAENLIWGKKFKIRVKSKATGKAVDFNISFTSKKLPNNESA